MSRGSAFRPLIFSASSGAAVTISGLNLTHAGGLPMNFVYVVYYPVALSVRLGATSLRDRWDWRS